MSHRQWWRRENVTTQLKIALVQSGERAYAVAHRAGLSETKLSRIVAGRRAASAEEKARIALALSRAVADLFPQAAETAP